MVTVKCHVKKKKSTIVRDAFPLETLGGFELKPGSLEFVEKASLQHSR